MRHDLVNLLKKICCEINWLTFKFGWTLKSKQIVRHSVGKITYVKYIELWTSLNGLVRPLVLEYYVSNET
jgi:hypothetical protein